MCNDKKIEAEGRQAILQMKYARIVNYLTEMYNISHEEAMDKFYTSRTFEFIRDGVSDLHCRSDKYLAQEIMLETKIEK